MTALNAGAQWAFDRLVGLDPTQPCWNGPAVIAAMRRHFVALGLSVPDWVAVVGSPAEAIELMLLTRSRTDEYVEATRKRVTDELAIGSASRHRFNIGADRVFDHPLTEALVSTRGGWRPSFAQDGLLPVIYEVAVAVGARCAVLDADLIWVWDQTQVAFENGLGWFALGKDVLILLPRPVLSMPRDRLHNVAGPAVRWPDGSESYYFEGVEFDRADHDRVARRNMTATEALAFDDPDRELLAMAAAPPDEVLALLQAVHLDTGAKGTRLYRVDGHFEPGRTDYCITMRDPSTGRLYLEWVDPEIGRLHDAELCQAHAFGIDLCDWLSLKSEA